MRCGRESQKKHTEGWLRKTVPVGGNAVPGTGVRAMWNFRPGGGVISAHLRT